VIPIVSLLVVLAASLLLTRVATVALVHTGMGRESARFQARSAFTGVGFTTAEAESVVGHPVRRRIVMWLMLVGNAGIVTAVASLLLSFIDMRSSETVWVGAPLLAAGVVVIGLAASSQWLDQRLGALISWALRRWTDLDARDYARLLHLRGDYGVSELSVEEGDWLAGQTLGDSHLAREGVLVLGVECPGGHFIGAPGQDVALRPGDRLVLYGRTPRIAEIDRGGPGRGGDDSHQDAVTEQQHIHAQETTSADR
jgi:hypothetical protein